MANIYDNIESKFVNGLQDLITDVGIKRVDFCVGYFNLRGWNLVVNQIDQIPGEYVYENDKQMKSWYVVYILHHKFQMPLTFSNVNWK